MSCQVMVDRQHYLLRSPQFTSAVILDLSNFNNHFYVTFYAVVQSVFCGMAMYTYNNVFEQKNNKIENKD